MSTATRTGRQLVDRFRLLYHSNMDWDAVWDVGKWILAALAAGFVGQFGKSLALRLISRRSRRKAAATVAEEPHAPAAQQATLEEARIEALAKIEKKRAKAEVKRRKKAGKGS